MNGMDVVNGVSWSSWTPQQEEEPAPARVEGVVKEDDKKAPPPLGQQDFVLAGRLSGVGSASLDQLTGVPQLERKPLSGGLHGLGSENPYEGMLGALRTAALRRDAAAVVAEREVAAPAAAASTASPATRLVLKDWRDLSPSSGRAEAAPAGSVPAPAPEPDPAPVPGPDPTPDPVPAPDPAEDPTPDPNPDPDPPPPPPDPVGDIIGGLLGGLGGLLGHH